MQNMLHIPVERLAALGDEQPTPHEAVHLASCGECTVERDAYVSLVGLAQAEAGARALPLSRFDSIFAELELDRPAADQPFVASVAGHARRTPQRMLRIAAGFLLVAGGAIAGRVSAGARALPDYGSSTVTALSPAEFPLDTAAHFASADDARAAQQRSELLYQQAAAFLARTDSPGSLASSPTAVRSRLAALDQVITTTREAMSQAPHDPVINGYYLTTLGQREATIQQLNNALPSTMQMNSF